MWLSVTKDSDGKSWNQTERTKNQALLDLLRFTNYSPALSPAAALRHTLLCDVATRANRHFQTHDALLCFRELQTNTESGQGVPAWEHQKRISLQVSPPPLGSVRRSPGVQLSASLASSTLVLYLVQYLGLPYLTPTSLSSDALCSRQGLNARLLRELNGPWRQVQGQVARRLSSAGICLRAGPSSPDWCSSPASAAQSPAQTRSTCFCQKTQHGRAAVWLKKQGKQNY